MLQHLWLHHGVEQHLVRSLDGRQHVETFHQVRHAHVVVALGFLLTGFQQRFVQQPVRVLWIELDVVAVIGVGMYPDSVFATFEYAAQDSCQ